jgi:hypothetical protein
MLVYYILFDSGKDGGLYTTNYQLKLLVTVQVKKCYYGNLVALK